MQNQGINRPFIITAILSTILFIYCSKFTTTETGDNIISNFTDSLLVKDTTIEVQTQTFLAFDDDTSKCSYFFDGSNNNLLFASLGKMSNNNFGTTTASIFFSIERANYTTNPFTGTGISLDSMVLKLKVKTYYGDTINPISINVYPLLDTVKNTVNGYYKFSDKIKYDANSLLANKQFNIKDLSNDNKTNQISIPLSNAFGNTFINANANVWESISNFKTFCKGFAILPESINPNAIVNTNLLDTGTYVVLYYKSTETGSTSTTQKSIKFYLTVTNTGFVNNLIWDKSSALINTYFNTNVNNQDFAFLQCNQRTKVKLIIPDLETLNPNWIIFKAELVAKEIYESKPATSTLLSPKYLFAFIDSNNNQFASIPKDYDKTNSYANQLSYIGGYRIDTTDENNNRISMYQFNISRYVQSIILKKTVNYPLVISAFNYSPFSDGYNVYNQIANGSVKLAGGNNTNKKSKMCVRIIYKTK